MILYGIKNCDTMQKAFKFLDKKKIKFDFHDYKEKGIDKATIKNWMNQFPTDMIINTRSTTFRNLSEEDQHSINNKMKAIQLMITNTSIIKRPLADLEDGKYLIGFKEEEWLKTLFPAG